MNAASGGYSAAQAVRTGGKAEVRDALVTARARTLLLADAFTDGLASHALQVPYRATLNPPLWEWGHVAWFQEWWIGRNRQRARGVACDPDHARAPSLMANADALYDSGRVAHATRWHLPLPGASGTRDYMAATFDQTLAALIALDANAGDDDLYFFRLVALHEHMHAEAACYMAGALGIAVPPRALRPVPALQPAPCALHVPAREFVAGWSGPGFAFDNELQPVTVRLEAFDIDAQPVSWEQFLEFVHATGHGDRDSWAQRAQAGAAAAHLTASDAQAWCRWAGRRLPTEFEWECAALTDPDFTWGQVWEWTGSPFEPYPGFGPHPYRDYSAPWFGSRRVLRGACPATSHSLAHPRYRNFFEPQRSDIFSGFRSCA
ncbi:MAG TPA: SUMF1/EgtB/PvdO family nonheme iron enzyme [Ramlibacter sp.]|nr:SUMF1/EgtB/PvdO family nonheme iron enzyme [Ramlibacter sp.]